MWIDLIATNVTTMGAPKINQNAGLGILGQTQPESVVAKNLNYTKKI
jgi:hypothetical protein